MLDVNDLVEGVTKVKVLSLPNFVYQKVGDVGTFSKKGIKYNNNIIGVTFGDIQVGAGDEGLYWFDPKDLEIVENIQKEVTNQSPDMYSQSEYLIIYKSRWDEIIENLSKPLNCMSDEEVEIVKSVLKNNIPVNVVPNLVDSVIEKEQQTHLDANYVGVGRNGYFYYRSDILKQWFYWNGDYEWVWCDFDYNDIGDVLPVSFGIVIGESK